MNLAVLLAKSWLSLPRYTPTYLLRNSPAKLMNLLHCAVALAEMARHQRPRLLFIGDMAPRTHSATLLCCRLRGCLYGLHPVVCWVFCPARHPSRPLTCLEPKPMSAGEPLFYPAARYARLCHKLSGSSCIFAFLLPWLAVQSGRKAQAAVLTHVLPTPCANLG